jgi:bacterioferritin-associated ferredoxin
MISDPDHLCRCHHITEADVAKAVVQGAQTIADIFRLHGVQPRCAECAMRLHQARKTVGKG